MAQKRILWFRRLALAGALLAAAVVVLGAWVRLTDAGLGCPDWPGCYGHIYPQMQGGFAKAMHEMIHRYFAGTLGTLCFAVMLFALWNRKDPAQPRIAPALLFLIVCFQAVLGALTVTRLLKPLIVTGHLLGGLTTLGILCWLSMTPSRQPFYPRERSLRKFALIGFAALIVQVFLGGWTSTNYAAVACPDLPTCQQSYWPPMDFKDAFVLWRGMEVDYTGGVLSNPARTAIHVTHRIGAVIAGLVLLCVGGGIALRSDRRPTKLAAALIVPVVLLQLGIGASMVYFGMPLALATLHNAGAALLVICLVSLLRTLWPARTVGVIG